MYKKSRRRNPVPHNDNDNDNININVNNGGKSQSPRTATSSRARTNIGEDDYSRIRSHTKPLLTSRTSSNTGTGTGTDTNSDTKHPNSQKEKKNSQIMAPTNRTSSSDDAPPRRTSSRLRARSRPTSRAYSTREDYSNVKYGERVESEVVQGQHQRRGGKGKSKGKAEAKVKSPASTSGMPFSIHNDTHGEIPNDNLVTKTGHDGIHIPDNLVKSHHARTKKSGKKQQRQQRRSALLETTNLHPRTRFDQKYDYDYHNNKNDDDDDYGTGGMYQEDIDLNINTGTKPKSTGIGTSAFVGTPLCDTITPRISNLNKKELQKASEAAVSSASMTMIHTNKGACTSSPRVRGMNMEADSDMDLVDSDMDDDDGDDDDSGMDMDCSPGDSIGDHFDGDEHIDGNGDAGDCGSNGANGDEYISSTETEQTETDRNQSSNKLGDNDGKNIEPWIDSNGEPIVTKGLMQRCRNAPVDDESAMKKLLQSCGGKPRMGSTAIDHSHAYAHSHVNTRDGGDQGRGSGAPLHPLDDVTLTSATMIGANVKYNTLHMNMHAMNDATSSSIRPMSDNCSVESEITMDTALGRRMPHTTTRTSSDKKLGAIFDDNDVNTSESQGRQSQTQYLNPTDDNQMDEFSSTVKQNLDEDEASRSRSEMIRRRKRALKLEKIGIENLHHGDDITSGHRRHHHQVDNHKKTKTALTPLLERKNMSDCSIDDESENTLHTVDKGTRCLVTHPKLPSGWKIKVSRSKGRPYYVHPDHGSTYHCPVVERKPVRVHRLKRFKTKPSRTRDNSNIERVDNVETDGNQQMKSRYTDHQIPLQHAYADCGSYDEKDEIHIATQHHSAKERGRRGRQVEPATHPFSEIESIISETADKYSDFDMNANINGINVTRSAPRQKASTPRRSTSVPSAKLLLDSKAASGESQYLESTDNNDDEEIHMHGLSKNIESNDDQTLSDSQYFENGDSENDDKNQIQGHSDGIGDGIEYNNKKLVNNIPYFGSTDDREDSENQPYSCSKNDRDWKDIQNQSFDIAEDYTYDGEENPLHSEKDEDRHDNSCQSHDKNKVNHESESVRDENIFFSQEDRECSDIGESAVDFEHDDDEVGEHTDGPENDHKREAQFEEYEEHFSHNSGSSPTSQHGDYSFAHEEESCGSNANEMEDTFSNQTSAMQSCEFRAMRREDLITDGQRYLSESSRSQTDYNLSQSDQSKLHYGSDITSNFDECADTFSSSSKRETLAHRLSKIDNPICSLQRLDEIIAEREAANILAQFKSVREKKKIYGKKATKDNKKKSGKRRRKALVKITNKC